MKTRKISEEVLFADSPLVKVGRSDITALTTAASQNQRRRIRLCAHQRLDDKVHEMMIVHMRDAYVRPHKHMTKSESFHIIVGTVDIFLFDENGSIVEVFQMGDYSSGRPFYYRLAEARYHSLMVTSDYVVFHETANGPFDRSDTVFPSWAPDEHDIVSTNKFLERLSNHL